MRWTVGWLLATACSDYGVSALPKAEDPTDDSGTTPVPPTTTDPPPSTTSEVCDGVDNDGDGKVDEGFPDDIDGDGIKDCVDDACDVGSAGSSTVSPLSECQPYDPTAVANPWNVALEWSFTAGGSIVVSPVTGELTDDNGDGLVDSRDIPDVAFTSFSDSSLYIVSGDGSGLICSQPGWNFEGGVIIADVDSDGRNEVVGPFGDNSIHAVDGACNTEWASAVFPSLLYPITTAADLDHDGDVEVISDYAVVDGATGATLGTLATNTLCWRAPTTGDLDQDGDTEIVLGDSVYDWTGTKLWTAAASGTSCFDAIINLDADPQAEVVFSIGTQLLAYEDTGALKWTAPLTVANPGPPCAGDIDGDGLAEVIAPSGTNLIAFENDGTQKWSMPMQDASGAAGCSVFDMNGDGVYEVLFADETALRVYDGTTGAVLYQNDAHDSVTVFETPVVADVDNDGSAEMLVVNSPFSYYGGTTGLTVFGHNGSGWPASGPTWGLHDFSATNQDPDGTIPTGPVAPWLQYDIYRGRPYDDFPGTANLAASVVDVCVSSCNPAVGVVTISYQVHNDGGLEAPETQVGLYLVAGGTSALYATQTAPTAAIGEVQASLSFDVPLADWTGEFLLVADDGAAVTECHEDDNVVDWVGEVCP